LIQFGTLTGFRTSRDAIGRAKLDLPRRDLVRNPDRFRTSRDALGRAKLDLPRRDLVRNPDRFRTSRDAITSPRCGGGAGLV
jgi:hypothetical protein